MNGFQGYVTSREFQGQRVPQHVQNLVIRDYCQGLGLRYLLSGTEYAIPGSRLMLRELLDNLDHLEGIVFYSLFQLPENFENRKEIYQTVFQKRKTLHFAVETIVLEQNQDCQRLEDIWGVYQVMKNSTNVLEMI